MKSHSIYKNMRLITGLTLLVFIFLGCSDVTTSNEQKKNKILSASHAKETKQQPLLTILKQRNIQLSVNQNKYLSSVINSPTSTEIHIGQLVADPFAILKKDKVIQLSVTPNKTLHILGKKATHHSSNNISWGGSVQNQKGWAGLMKYLQIQQQHLPPFIMV